MRQNRWSGLAGAGDQDERRSRILRSGATQPREWATHWRWLWALVVSIAFPACASALIADPFGPGVPRISELEIAPARVTAGCSITMRFRVEDTDADVLHAVVAWTLDRQRLIGSETTVVPIEGPLAIGREVDRVALTLTPKIWGRYRYSVQVEDAAGHRSNVLTGAVLADGPLLLQPRRCQ